MPGFRQARQGLLLHVLRYGLGAGDVRQVPGIGSLVTWQVATWVSAYVIVWVAWTVAAVITT